MQKLHRALLVRQACRRMHSTTKVPMFIRYSWRVLCMVPRAKEQLNNFGKESWRLWTCLCRAGD
jgi:hypothetical protein